MTQGPAPGLLLRPPFLWARGLCWGSGLGVRSQWSPSFPICNTMVGDNSETAKVPLALQLSSRGAEGKGLAFSSVPDSLRMSLEGQQLPVHSTNYEKNVPSWRTN